MSFFALLLASPLLHSTIDFSFAVTEEERDLIARGRYDALIEQQKRNDAAFEEEVCSKLCAWIMAIFQRNLGGHQC